LTPTAGGATRRTDIAGYRPSTAPAAGGSPDPPTRNTEEPDRRITIARGANGSGQRHDVVAGGHGELIGAVHTDGGGHPVEHLVR
jgi:hypothetical protein